MSNDEDQIDPRKAKQRTAELRQVLEDGRRIREERQRKKKKKTDASNGPAAFNRMSREIFARQRGELPVGEDADPDGVVEMWDDDDE